MKKIIALVLSAIMLMSVLSVGISAAETINFYGLGARNAIVKFFDTGSKNITPVEIQLINIPAKFNGKIAIVYANDKTLEDLSSRQFTAKYNTIYNVKATTTAKVNEHNTIYVTVAADETLDYERVVYVKVPKGYVAYPEQKTIIVGDADSWKVSCNVITDAAYADILAAEKAAAEKAAAEKLAAEKAAAEAAAAEATAAAIAVVDVDAILAELQTLLGEALDLSTIITDLDADGTISFDELLVAYVALATNEAITPEVYAQIEAAIETLIGLSIADLILTLVVVDVVEAPADATDAVEAPVEAPAETPAA